MRRLAILLLLALAACQPGGFYFTITFRGADSLKPGDAVVYKGTKIGEVEKIDVAGSDVRVRVSIDAAHRADVYREAIYVIDSPGAFFDAGRQITVKDRPFLKARSPIASGEIVSGWHGVLGRTLGRILP